MGLLNDDLAGHFRMDRAEVAVSAGFREREGEFLVGVEDFRFECFGIIRAHSSVESVNSSSFPYPSHLSPCLETPIPRSKTPVATLVFVADPQSSWRAARVRESREPAPRMGRVSFVQTARRLRLFPDPFKYSPNWPLTTCWQIRQSKGGNRE